jgi:benzoate-CoA ligase
MEKVEDSYNAADALIGANLKQGRGERIAVSDAAGRYSYAELSRRVNRFANVLERYGIAMEQRILLCLSDSIDFPSCFLGAVKAGVVPVPVNTLLTPQEYEYMLLDSRARLLVVSRELLDKFRPVLARSPFLETALVSGGEGEGCAALEAELEQAAEEHVTAPTRPDDVAFWLYTSGTTGQPKGVMHVQTSLEQTARCYAQPVLGITAEDVVFSAAKLFFAYGLGNALTFPFLAGASAVLLPERPSPEAVCTVLNEHRPTIFFGVPTLYSMMLNTGALPDPGNSRLRLCVSAGEALPENLFHRWREATGLEIIDGIGSTEMLHIFMSNRPGVVRPGTSGRPVDGYEVRLLNESGGAVPDGEVGDLYVKGPSSALGYWNRLALSRETFAGGWTRTDDKYVSEPDGCYRYCGRADDMLKVGGIYVSPMEVENVLLGHPAVAEAAVVGGNDGNGLLKPKAYVVSAAGIAPTPELAQELIAHVRDVLADYKRPRWVQFVDALPKTATGKIQRFKLRESI